MCFLNKYQILFRFVNYNIPYFLKRLNMYVSLYIEQKKQKHYFIFIYEQF